MANAKQEEPLWKEVFRKNFIQTAKKILQKEKLKNNGTLSFKTSEPRSKNKLYKKAQNLLNVSRGNKALTPEQQKELFEINKKNLQTLKTMWKNEHL